MPPSDVPGEQAWPTQPFPVVTPPLTRTTFSMDDIATVTPQNNLAVQAHVISRSLGFVGTYGGVAQLAQRRGKPSVSFYSDWGGTAWAHKHLSEMVGAAMAVSFQVQRIGDVPLLQQILPRFQVQ